MFSTDYLNYNILDISDQNSYLKALPINLLGVQSWFYGRIDAFPLESSQLYANVAWSISTELLLYVFFIPFAIFISRFGVGATRGVVILFIAIAGRFLVIVFSSNVFEIGIENQDLAHWLIYTSPYGRWFEFMAGIGVAELWLSGLIKRRVFKVLGFASLIYILISIFSINGQKFGSIFYGDAIHLGYALCVPFIIALFCIAEKQHNFQYKYLLLLGELSYSVYFIHGDLYPLFISGWGHAATNIVSFFVALIFLSFFSYNVIEMPGKRMFNKIFNSKK